MTSVEEQEDADTVSGAVKASRDIDDTMELSSIRPDSVESSAFSFSVVCEW